MCSSWASGFARGDFSVCGVWFSSSGGEERARVAERGEGGAEPVVTPVAALLRDAALGGGVACSIGTKDSRRQLIGGAASRRSGLLGAELGMGLGAGLLCASSEA